MVFKICSDSKKAGVSTKVLLLSPCGDVILHCVYVSVCRQKGSGGGHQLLAGIAGRLTDEDKVEEFAGVPAATHLHGGKKGILIQGNGVEGHPLHMVMVGGQRIMEGIGGVENDPEFTDRM